MSTTTGSTITLFTYAGGDQLRLRVVPRIVAGTALRPATVTAVTTLYDGLIAAYKAAVSSGAQGTADVKSWIENYVSTNNRMSELPTFGLKVVPVADEDDLESKSDAFIAEWRASLQ